MTNHAQRIQDWLREYVLSIMTDGDFMRYDMSMGTMSEIGIDPMVQFLITLMGLLLAALGGW